MESLRTTHPDHKIVLSFFSPSGYENKKNTPLADVVVYLPMDTRSNAEKFIDKVHPSLVFFVKYEFWPNYLVELKRQEISTLLISGVFRENQVFFKPYAGFMRKALDSFDHFFLQNQASKELLAAIGLNNTSVSGDTRFDRVSRQIEMDNTLDFIDRFKKDWPPHRYRDCHLNRQKLCLQHPKLLTMCWLGSGLRLWPKCRSNVRMPCPTESRSNRR